MTGAPAPRLTAGGSLVRLLATVSAVVATASLLAPWLPEERGPGWALAQRSLLADSGRSVPSWWMAAIFVAAALACHDRAGAEAGAGRRPAAVAWWLLAGAMAWISLDHTLVLHDAVPWMTEDELPGVLGRYPVEVVLVAVMAPAAVLAWATGGRPQRLLLLAAAVAFVAGQVGVGRLGLGLAEHRTELLESVLQWTGAIGVVAAAARSGTTRRSER